jgi:hypothetical protein
MAVKQKMVDYLYNQAYDVDEDVKRYLDKIEHVERSMYKPFKHKIPHFTNKSEQLKWEFEEIRRTRNGHGGISGMMYLYTYYWKMKSKNGGIMLPQFRWCNSQFFNLIESCLYGEHPDGLYGDNTGKGVILVGRRRWGKSYSLANAMYATAIHNRYTDIGFTSKTEKDMQEFFSKVFKTGYDNLPEFLRASASSNTQDRIEFAKKIKQKDGTWRKAGLNTTIFGRSPEPTSFEGKGLRMVVYEEPGKWDAGQLQQNWSYTLPALADDDGITRKGVPILAGTAGDIGLNGDDFKTFWYKAKDYGLEQFFAAGYSGFKIEDDMGNENIIEGIRYILDQREKEKRQSLRRYYDFIVQYPLDPEEAFIIVGETPFNIDLINGQVANLDLDPPIIKRGFFRRDMDDKVVFVPKEDGDCRILEEPQSGFMYAAGSDPTDGAISTSNGSDLSFFIAKGMITDEYTAATGAVFQYTAKPEDINEAYEQCALACEYYSVGGDTCTVLIERNRARMLTYFQENGYKHLLARRPKKVDKGGVISSRVKEYGGVMDEQTKGLIIGMIDDDINSNISNYKFADLLMDCSRYNPNSKTKKFDRVDAWGWTLMNLKTKRHKKAFAHKTDDNFFQGIGFTKDKSGRIVRN